MIFEWDILNGKMVKTGKQRAGRRVEAHCSQSQLREWLRDAVDEVEHLAMGAGRLAEYGLWLDNMRERIANTMLRGDGPGKDA